MWFRVCVTCGGSNTYLGNSLKIGPVVVGPDGPRSCADGPDMCRSANLLPICGCSGMCPSASHKGVVTGRDNL
jgi:hypothetical protein